VARRFSSAHTISRASQHQQPEPTSAECTEYCPGASRGICTWPNAGARYGDTVRSSRERPSGRAHYATAKRPAFACLERLLSCNRAGHLTSGHAPKRHYEFDSYSPFDSAALSHCVIKINTGKRATVGTLLHGVLGGAHKRHQLSPLTTRSYIES
jgi:hypothetical protein